MKMENNEKQEAKKREFVNDFKLRLVRPISADEVIQLKKVFKKETNCLWKYLQEKEPLRGKKLKG